jgi:hypothetical protein
MDTGLARQIALAIADLMQPVSIFQSCFGKDYRLKPGSPTQVWELHQAIKEQQVLIASLLDASALESPIQRLPQWWKYQEMPDVGTVTAMMQEACHLIAACSCHEANPQTAQSPVLATAQRVLAGMLHPATLMMAQDRSLARAS